MRRRDFLAVSGTTALAGCVEEVLVDDTDEDGVRNVNDEYPENPNRTDQLQKFQNNIFFQESYRWRIENLQTNWRADFELQILMGDTGNVFLLTDTQYKNFLSGQPREPRRKWLDVREVSHSVSTEDLPADDNGYNVVVTRANVDQRFMRVYINWEMYR